MTSPSGPSGDDLGETDLVLAGEPSEGVVVGDRARDARRSTRGSGSAPAPVCGHGGRSLAVRGSRRRRRAAPCRRAAPRRRRRRGVAVHGLDGRRHGRAGVGATASPARPVVVLGGPRPGRRAAAPRHRLARAAARRSAARQGARAVGRAHLRRADGAVDGGQRDLRRPPSTIPTDALGRAYGVPTALSLDLEWYAAPRRSSHRTRAGYEQAGVVHGRDRAAPAAPLRARRGAGPPLAPLGRRARPGRPPRRRSPTPGCGPRSRSPTARSPTGCSPRTAGAPADRCDPTDGCQHDGTVMLAPIGCSLEDVARVVGRVEAWRGEACSTCAARRRDHQPQLPRRGRRRPAFVVRLPGRADGAARHRSGRRGRGRTSSRRPRHRRRRASPSSRRRHARHRVRRRQAGDEATPRAGRSRRVSTSIRRLHGSGPIAPASRSSASSSGTPATPRPSASLVPAIYDELAPGGARIEAAFARVIGPCRATTTCCRPTCCLAPTGSWLIDFEYAGMNDALFDLANLSVNCGFDEAADERLLRRYDGDVSAPRLAPPAADEGDERDARGDVGRRAAGDQHARRRRLRRVRARPPRPLRRAG